jgi:RimJ/RimL family protein N-acetyltransferase
MTEAQPPEPWPPEVELSGRLARLTPLRAEHAEGLAEASRDGDLQRLWFTVVPSAEGMAANIAERLAKRAQGSMLPFTVVDARSGRLLGMTTYMNIDAVNRRVEIGSTWYRASAQRSGVNVECKRMLLAHAFEQLDCIAVEFRTHLFNHRSRRAIEGLGAKLDGVLRNHSRTREGLLRDTCVYSIIASEWPTVRRHLDFRLESAETAGAGPQGPALQAQPAADRFPPDP